MTTEAGATAGEIAKDVLALGSVAAPFIPISLAQAIIILAAKYGPEVIDRIEEVLSKDEITVDEVRGIFGGLKTWDQLGIPDKVPVAVVEPQANPNDIPPTDPPPAP